MLMQLNNELEYSDPAAADRNVCRLYLKNKSQIWVEDRWSINVNGLAADVCFCVVLV